MPSSKDFKQAIKEGRIRDAFVLAISQAPELQITTWIASAETAKTSPESGKFLRTEINLVEGEITNKIGGKIIEDHLYRKAQNFHTQQVSQGHQAISHNLESLQQILRLATILQKQKRGESYQPLKPFKISSTSLPESNVFQLSERKNLTQSSDTNSPYINPISILTEDDAVEDNMLSLGDLEAEADKIDDDTNLENKDNDWGDWLEDGDDDNLDLDTDILTLDAFDLDESEEWENETEFLPNSEIASVKKDEKNEQ